ncbi:MAG TPA: chemotaxis protein CheD [Caulobacteraceae bacterium]|nr:chemotaxis protein CheD [Caulobacteraceae bacterium]
MTAVADLDLRRVFIQAGEWRCAAEPTVITTVLGSCVAVCLWDADTRIGGMNHFMLPASPGHEGDGRYSDVAVAGLIEAMTRLGARRKRMTAKLFGGAGVLAAAGEAIGDLNIAEAVALLRQARVPVAVQRTGGRAGRLIRFHTGTGEVEVQRLGRTLSLIPGGRT